MDGPSRRPLEQRRSEGSRSAAETRGRGKRFGYFAATGKVTRL
jgi:hypothetical protein